MAVPHPSPGPIQQPAPLPYGYPPPYLPYPPVPYYGTPPVVPGPGAPVQGSIGVQHPLAGVVGLNIPADYQSVCPSM